ncbi:hypothetical protein [Brevibacillus thermoruber]|uniref:hypothetical protein n=1 Tax=Brevibacillus thermoruber TaxID=33942 RepID=UPI00054DBEC9|nr:hypothetical protein [Brevibacillus thermoruber]
MAILITHDGSSATKARVEVIHYQPQYLPPEVIEKGIIVDEVPDPNPPANKVGILFINPQTQEMWYEYVDRPLTPEERIAQLEEQLRITQEAVDALLLG